MVKSKMTIFHFYTSVIDPFSILTFGGIVSDVPILHLISNPFPPTWHTASDNEANLDFPSISHIRNVMKIFVIEYLHLPQQVC